MRKNRRNKRQNSRDAPAQGSTGSMVGLVTPQNFRALLCAEYRPLSECPEVAAAVNVYANSVAAMTIHQMENTKRGDIRVRDDLSRVVDIEPNRIQTHQAFYSTIVRALILYGNQVTIPEYSRGRLRQLKPVPPGLVSFVSTGDPWNYRISIGGTEFRPDEVLHFVFNPDMERPWRGLGMTVGLRDAVKAIRATGDTKNALMESPMPSVIVKVDGLNELMQSPEGREKLAAQYVDSTSKGKPWFIPARVLEVSTVKPLTLADLAISTSIELDKKTIASLLGVPPYLIGVGSFNRDEYNNFIQTNCMFIAQAIQQTLTRGIGENPARYWRFNPRGLLDYDLQTKANVAKLYMDSIAMYRNEGRDWIGLPPDENMDELLALENYIPATMAAKQKKLVQTGTQEGEQQKEGGESE